jgi:E3 ubiquitin-protein ligase MUL1
VLQNAPVLELNYDLKEIVKTHPNQKLPYVVIRGEVEALGSPITSINNHSITGTIQKLSMKEHVVARGSAGFWFVKYILLFICMPSISYTAN